MARTKQSNPDLPSRVYKNHGRFWYVPKKELRHLFNNNSWVDLGADKTDAMLEWARILKVINAPCEAYNVSAVFDRYLLEVLPTKSPKTQKEQGREMRNLRAFFGQMAPQSVKSSHVREYRDLRGQKAKVGANRELSLLSHVFAMACEWNIVETNPCLGVKRNKETPSSDYIEHVDFIALHKFLATLGDTGTVLQLGMEGALLIGQRRADILKIKRSDLLQDGISLYQNKTFGRTKKLAIYKWTPELRQWVNKAISFNRGINSIYLIHNRAGQPYTSNGFKSLWKRAMRKAVKQKILAQPFKFKDIRAKRSSDSESLQQASTVLMHSSLSMTKKHYMRKPEMIDATIPESLEGVFVDLGYSQVPLPIEKQN